MSTAQGLEIVRHAHVLVFLSSLANPLSSVTEKGKGGDRVTPGNSQQSVTSIRSYPYAVSTQIYRGHFVWPYLVYGLPPSDHP